MLLDEGEQGKTNGGSVAGIRGCRVLDLAGPSGQYCGKLLADLGADVIKIEPPDGDPARSLGPFSAGGTGPERSLFFAYYNTNKRSLAVDLASARGREILVRLLAGADVVIQTSGLDAVEPPVLQFSEVAPAYPRLILTTLTAFGTGGPYASYRATSLSVFAMSGIMHNIGPREGPPAGMPGQIALDVAAADAAAGTLMALIARRRTGRGQAVDVAAFEVLAAQLGAPSAQRAAGGRAGRLHAQLAPSGIYPCRDGAVEFSTLLPGQWQRLKQLLTDTPELQAPEWDDRAYRIANAERLYAIVADAVRDRTKADLTEQAQRLQIPCLPVNSVADVIASEQMQSRGFFVDMETGGVETGDVATEGAGLHAFPGAPYTLSEQRWSLRRPAPAPGEDTAGILTGELGFTAEAVAGLEKAGLIARGSAGSRALMTNEPAAPLLPLEGVRVLTFSTAFAGPTTSRYLADFGAEVIKVESRRRPDNTRGAGGPYVEPSGANTAPNFQHFNRNKLGIAIDLSQPAGQTLLHRLVGVTDVIMNNFSRRVLRGWGLAYEHARAIRPDIIMLDMQGLGQTGPWRDYVTFGATVQSFAGLTGIWGYSHGGFADYIAAEHAVVAILAAILDRFDSGRGLHIDLAQTETTAALLGTFFLDYAVNGRVADSTGTQGRPGAPSGCFRCLGDDAWCVIDITGDGDWLRLHAALDSPPWSADPSYQSQSGRLAHLTELNRHLEEWTRERTPEEVEATLQSHGVAAAAVRPPRQVFDDPQLAARGFYRTIEHAIIGPADYAGPTARLSETPARAPLRAPYLGEQNDYVFGEILGLGRAEIEQFTEEGILS